MIHTTCSSTHAHTSFLPFNRKVCKSSECCGFKIYVWEWFKECAHVLRGVLFVQLILLWSSSRSSTRGPTVVLAFSSILLSSFQFPLHMPKSCCLRDVSPAATFLYWCRLGPNTAVFSATVRQQVILKEWELLKSSQADINGSCIDYIGALSFLDFLTFPAGQTCCSSWLMEYLTSTSNKRLLWSLTDLVGLMFSLRFWSEEWVGSLSQRKTWRT